MYYCMGVASGCGEQEAGVASGCGEQEADVASGSGWNLWVWLLGVVIRRYIDFLILLIPTPLVSVLFCSSIPSFFNTIGYNHIPSVYLGLLLFIGTKFSGFLK